MRGETERSPSQNERLGDVLGKRRESLKAKFEDEDAEKILNEIPTEINEKKKTERATENAQKEAEKAKKEAEWEEFLQADATAAKTAREKIARGGNN